MNKDAQRIKRWRERRRAEGKKSFTLVLSKESQEILDSEKEMTGETYSAIVEKALLGLKKPTFRPPLKYPPSWDHALAHRSASIPGHAAGNVASHASHPGEDGGHVKLLIDDLANEPLNDILEGNLAHGGKDLLVSDIKLNQGFLTRLLDLSRQKLFRGKKPVK